MDTKNTLAQSERSALADLLEQVGPEHPTLCEGWQTSDLLTHLLLRERRPDGAIGLIASPLKRWTDRVTAGFEALGWQGQIELLRDGPPAWNPMGWGRLDELANSAEFFIHHEDVRRGTPDWQPRDLGQETRDAVEALLRSPVAGLKLRPAKVGVMAMLDGGSMVPLRTGSPVARVHGPPADVLLWASGRSAVRVRLDGDDAALAALTEAGFGAGDGPQE